MRFLHTYNLLHTHNLRQARVGVCLLGLLAGPLLAGCGGGGGGNGNSGGGTTGTTSGTNSGTNTGVQPPLSVSGVTATGLTATISEPSATVSVGGTVTYTLTLTNATATTIPVHATSTPSMPSAVVTVTGPDNKISYEPLPGQPPLSNGSLAPGQSISTTMTASGFTTAGTYSAVATFGDDVTAPKSIGPLTVTVQ